MQGLKLLWGGVQFSEEILGSLVRCWFLEGNTPHSSAAGLVHLWESYFGLYPRQRCRQNMKDDSGSVHAIMIPLVIPPDG